jgi:hypothetical protein
MIAFTTTVLAALALAAAPAAFAQHDHGAGEHVGGGPGRHAPGPYAGMRHRAVKSLSNQQPADLRAGTSSGRSRRGRRLRRPSPQQTATAAQAHGRLREAHLRYHLVMVEVLSPEQVAAYNRMRGY